MSSSGTIARNSAWLLVDNLASTLATLFTSITVARTLGPERYGALQYVLWASQMARLVAEMGVPLATRKFAAEYRGRGDHDLVRGIVRATLRFQTVVAFIVPAIGLLLVGSRMPTGERDYATLAVLSLFPALLMGVPTALLWTTENLLHTTKASLCGQAVYMLGVTATWLFDWNLVGIAAALLAGRTADLVVRRIYYRRELARLPGQAIPLDPELRRRLVRFCWHQSILLAIEVVVWNRSEMLFIEHFADKTQVGFFSMGFNLTQNVLLIPSLLSAAAGATLMIKRGAAPEEVGKLAGATLWVVALFAVPALFGLAAVSTPLLTTLFGSRYLPAALPMTIIAVFSVARALSYPLLEVLFASEKQGAVVRFSLVMLVFNLTFGFALIQSYAAVGAAISKGLTLLVTTIGLFVIAARATGLRVPVARLLRLLLCGGLMFALVRATTQGLSSLPAPLTLVAGILVGMASFMGLMRLLGVLSPDDRERLASLVERLPVRFRPSARALVTRL